MKRRDRHIEGVVDGTDSVVPHAARDDLKFVQQELVDGDIERVRAGMELMVWTYDAKEWHRHVQSSASRADAVASDEGNLFQSVLFGQRRAEWIRDRLRDVPLPTVVITSTGILFGQIARLWRGSRRLIDANVEDRAPRYLVLTFAKRWWRLTWARRELWVPVPEPLERGAFELAGTLNSWLERGSTDAITPRPS